MVIERTLLHQTKAPKANSVTSLMMVMTGGRERSASEFGLLF